MFTSNGHAPQTEGARPTMSRMEAMKQQSQKHVDEIATELIRGNFEIKSYEITRGMFDDTTKLNVVINGMKRHEVEITIKG